MYPARTRADMMFMDFTMALLLLPNTGDYFPIDKFRSGEMFIRDAFTAFSKYTVGARASVLRMLRPLLRIEFVFHQGKKCSPVFNRGHPLRAFSR